MQTQLAKVWLLNYLSNSPLLPLLHFERGSIVRWERERAWTVNPENSDSRITKIANPTPSPRYPPFSRINLSRMGERFRI